LKNKNDKESKLAHMPFNFDKYIIHKNKRNCVILVSFILIVAIATVTGVLFARNYIINQAETRIHDVLQEAEALHYYVQREMHPTLYQLKKEGRIPEEFYSPELLSSSYITRRVFNHYNRIRKKNNQLEVEYRMAAKNPRNKINQADSMEINLIDLFNRDTTIKKITGIEISHDEKHLYYAQPFLRVEKQCLRCHGRREDAPKLLREYYKWDSGFNLKEGEIPAIEIIKTPLKAELHTIMYIGAIILFISILIIVLIFLYSNLFIRNSIIKEQKIVLELNLKKLKETQNKLVESEKMASLGVLTAGVSHEINNPLNFINGAYLGLEKFFSENAPELKNEIAVLLRGLRTGINRVSEIVQGLNHFSRDSGNYNENCNVHSIIDNCLLMLKNTYKNRIEIEKSYLQNDIIIKGNEGKLHQVFINILTNAIQSIKSEGKIIIKTQMNKDSISVFIEDNGCGIGEENLSKIIEPFYTTKEPGEGTGLGLSISYSIIKKHKGDIEITSELHKKTIVKITFHTAY